MVTIREAQQADVEALGELKTTLDAETDFLGYGAGERKKDSQKLAERIRAMHEENAGAIFVAEDNGKLVGEMGAHQGSTQRRKHSAGLGIGVLKAYQGQGVGTKLFESMELWARKNNIHRIELEVMEHNAHAIELYEKLGFVREGIKRDAICIDGKFINNIVMAKLLN